MKKETAQVPDLSISVLGQHDFCRRLTALIRNSFPSAALSSGNIVEAWTTVLSSRPDILVIDAGHSLNDHTAAITRRFLRQLRERFGQELLCIAAVTAPEKAFYGGDFLFLSQEDLKPSGWIDALVVQPPAGLPSMPPLGEQVADAILSCSHEILRRAEGKPPLPALNDEGWAQSLADPQSRGLWAQWLPRYAGYTNENPLITGETGTGKTNLARALHVLSGRKGAFVSITPRDFSSSELVQAELFGSVAGAYTGAVDKWGLVKSAEQGTLFIDELQSIDKDLQGKIITFIENKAYRRVGSTESISADVRFVFASNRALYEMMENDTLRHDFAYRLERVQLEMKPLRQRRLDILAGLSYALAKIRRQRPHAQAVRGFSSQAWRLLFCQAWPGNLRQLENTVAQLCELCDMENTALINENHVSKILQARTGSKVSAPGLTTAEIVNSAALKLAREAMQQDELSIEQARSYLETQVRFMALEATGGDAEKAAELTGDDRALMKLAAKTLSAKRGAGV